MKTSLLNNIVLTVKYERKETATEIKNDAVERVSCSHGGSDDDEGGVCSSDGDSSMKKLSIVKKSQICEEGL